MNDLVGTQRIEQHEDETGTTGGRSVWVLIQDPVGGLVWFCVWSTAYGNRSARVPIDGLIEERSEVAGAVPGTPAAASTTGH